MEPKQIIWSIGYGTDSTRMSLGLGAFSDFETAKRIAESMAKDIGDHDSVVKWEFINNGMHGAWRGPFRLNVGISTPQYSTWYMWLAALILDEDVTTSARTYEAIRE